MPGIGYLQTFSSLPEHDRFAPESGPLKLLVRFRRDVVGLSPAIGRFRPARFMTADDQTGLKGQRPDH